MLQNGISAQNDIIGMAMQAASLANDVINNNIANVDVPGFKRSEVVFDTLLQNFVNTSRRGEASRPPTPQIVTQHANLSHRLDGNNVDIEAEMVALYQNSVRFDAMTAMLQSNSRRNSLAYS